MSKMPRDLSGDSVMNILGKHSCKFLRQGKGHTILEKKLNGESISVSVPNHNRVIIGTLLKIVRDSRKTRQEFIGISKEI